MRNTRILNETFYGTKDDSLFDIHSILSRENVDFTNLNWNVPSILKRGSGSIDCDLRDRELRLEDLELNSIVLNGSGFYHDRTYHLVNRMQKMSPLAYVHIDAHTDFILNGDFKTNSASFVRNINQISNVGWVSMVGIARDSTAIDAAKEHCDFYPGNATHFSTDYVPLDNVYVSVDLDVIEGFNSPWPGGEMKIERLLEILDDIGSNKNIIGADIVGYSKDHARWSDKRKLLDVYYSLKANMS